MGYILDRALEKARTAAPAATGIRIDIGGDAVYWGMPDDARGWQVAIADPRQPLDNAPGIARVQLRPQAIAASGHGSRGSTKIGRATVKGKSVSVRVKHGGGRTITNKN